MRITGLAVRQTCVLLAVALFVLSTLVAVEVTGQKDPNVIWLGRCVLLTILLCMAVLGLIAAPEPNLSVWVRAIKGLILWAAERVVRTCLVIASLLAAAVGSWHLGPGSLYDMSFRCSGVAGVTWRDWQNRPVMQPCAQFLQISIWHPLTNLTAVLAPIRCVGTAHSFSALPQSDGSLQCASQVKYHQRLSFVGNYELGYTEAHWLSVITPPMLLSTTTPGELTIQNVSMQATLTDAMGFYYDAHLLCAAEGRLLPLDRRPPDDWNTFRATYVDFADRQKGVHVEQAMQPEDGEHLMWQYPLPPGIEDENIRKKRADLNTLNANAQIPIACQVFLWTRAEIKPPHIVKLTDLTVELDGVINR